MVLANVRPAGSAAARLLLVRGAIGLVLALGLLSAAAADTPQSLGTFKEWRAMTVTADGARSCYALSEPVSRQGKVRDRGQSGAMVTHFPAIGALDQVSVVLGFPPAKKNGVVVRIGGTTFKLTEIDGDRAWARTHANDRALVQAMRKSNRMIVTSTTAKGIKVEDTYDLSGFTKAYQTMSKACS